MHTIITAPDCGNSPKMTFLKNFNQAFAKGNCDFILEQVDEDIVWNILGDKVIKGKKAFEQAIREMSEVRAEKMTILHLITHGKQGAANGEIWMPGGQKYAFSDVYEFTSTKGNKIKQIYSYVVLISS